MNRNVSVLTATSHWSVTTIGSAGLSLNPAIRSASCLFAAFAPAAIISIQNCQISSSLTSITRRRLSRMSWITNPRQSVRQMKRPCAAGRPSFYRRPRISRPCCAVVRNVHILCLVHPCWSSSAKQNANHQPSASPRGPPGLREQRPPAPPILLNPSSSKVSRAPNLSQPTYRSSVQDRRTATRSKLTQAAPITAAKPHVPDSAVPGTKPQSNHAPGRRS